MQRTGETGLSFNLRRFLGFLRLLLKNRMAAIGLIILVVSTVLAVSAPAVFPGDPRATTVGASFAQPEWVMLFPEGHDLSKNIVVVNDPAFTSPSALQEWSLRVADQSKLPSVSLSYSPRGIVASGGSLEVSSSSASAVNATVAKTFHYPYHGPPGQFLDLPAKAFTVIAQGASPSQPVFVRFFIDDGRKSLTLWAVNITKSGDIAKTGDWNTPPYNIDSYLSEFANAVGLGTTVTGLSPAEAVFSHIGDYSYGFEVSFHGPGKINVDNLGLVLYGTAHGVFGTDFYGDDLLGQNILGSRVSLFVGLLSAFIGIGLGLMVGLIAGYKTGITDEVLMRFTDMMLVIPGLPLLIVLVAVLGSSITNLIIVIGFLGWMGFARVIRSQVLSLKERPFIEAAKAAGAGTSQILTKHVFPNIVSLTYVNLALTVPGAILAEAALSFLGLGDPTVNSWGQILHRAEDTAAIRNWWVVIPPGLAIAIVSLSFVLIGYALDEIFNPKLRRRR